MTYVKKRAELVSIVLPVYREGGNIGRVLDDIRANLAVIDARVEIIAVDDGSEDETWSVLSEKARQFPSIIALRLSRNFGKELALCAGLEAARGDVVIVMDSDGQH